MFTSKVNSSLSGHQQNTNDENIFPEDRGGKMTVKGRPPAKRIALSTLNENVSRTKSFGIQKVPVKANLSSKDVHCVTTVQKPKQSFSIYQEGDETESLSDSATCFYTGDHKKPYQEQLCYDDESFMVLDTSLETPSERLHREELFQHPSYFRNIYEHLRGLEKKFQPSPGYMKKQPDITLSMRSVLVDWLVEVTEEYKMQNETLYLAVSFIDRFLSVMSVLRCKLQLVGTASMFIAAKFEEIFPPELKEFVYITDDTYSKKQVLRMEHLILKVLAFDLSSPTAYTFLQCFCSVVQIPDKVCHLAQYICELSLLEADPFLSFLPSEIAGASVYVANCTLERTPWTQELQQVTGYSVQDLSLCIKCLFRSYNKISDYPQQAVREKYKSSRYNCVANIAAPGGFLCLDL